MGRRSRRLLGLKTAALLCAATVVPRAEAGEPDWNDLMRDGGILLSRQPHNFGGLASDNLLRENEFLPPTWQWVADDFVLNQTSAIGRVNFWGFYDHNSLPGGTEDFRLRFYEPRNSDGLPGDVVYETSATDVPRTFTGRTIITSGAPAEYLFSLELSSPFVAEAGQQYWLEIIQVGNLESLFRWELSRAPPLNGQAFTNPVVLDWTATTDNSNTAFQLILVPEPTIILLALPFLFTLLIRHKR